MFCTQLHTWQLSVTFNLYRSIPNWISKISPVRIQLLIYNLNQNFIFNLSQTLWTKKNTIRTTQNKITFYYFRHQCCNTSSFNIHTRTREAISTNIYISHAHYIHTLLIHVSSTWENLAIHFLRLILSTILFYISQQTIINVSITSLSSQQYINNRSFLFFNKQFNNSNRTDSTLDSLMIRE